MRELTVSVMSGDLTSFLELAASRGVRAKQIIRVDPITAQMRVCSREAKIIQEISEIRGDECRLIQGIPLSSHFRNLLHRWVLAITGIILLILSFILPTRVLFVDIVGNARISKAQIMLAAEECGIYFGADRRPLRSVSVKNKLLELLPDLGWACINTNGCVATVKVIEKVISAGDTPAGELCTGIYAVKDGIIQDITVYSGFAEVVPGQAVKAGQILVSGSKQDGAVVRNTRSSADIFAVTTSDLKAAYMTEVTEIVIGTEQVHQYSLIMGKKLVNLEKKSRICTHECDKIKKEYYLSLPGGFALPIGIAVDSCICYNIVSVNEDVRRDSLMTEQYMRQYLSDGIVAGRILRMDSFPQNVDYNNRISARFYCYEMIGRERSEEIEISNGEND